MHELALIVYGVVHFLTAVSSTLAKWFASLKGHDGGDFTIAALIVSASVAVIASGLWTAGERARSAFARLQMSRELREARSALFFRDSLLTAGWESITVMGGHLKVPLNFGGGSDLLQAALGGPDAGPFAKSVDALMLDGQGFETTARTGQGRKIAFRGRPVGTLAAVYAHDESRSGADDIDYRELLDAIPSPAWLRDNTLRLKWANQAFLATTGDASLEAAVAADRLLERSELDLTASVLDNHQPVNAKRYVVVNGERRSLGIRIVELDHGGTAGMALDITDVAKSEAKLQIEMDAHCDVLDRLSTAVAVFGPNRHIMEANRAFIERFTLDEHWIESHPAFDEILESLRAAGRLPEQREFGAWKRRLLDLFIDPRADTEEVWHMPHGKSERMTSHPHPLGGLTFLFEDITQQLEIRSSYNTLVKVQRATLDTMDEAIAVFGLDGRLKLHNGAFGRLWQFNESDLAGEPHVRILGDICAARIGRDESWSIVIAGVNAAEPEKYDAWSTVTRADGKVVTLSLTRLPDGATMATFSDVTDYLRFESMLRHGARDVA